jgi:hypothetical protein
MFKVVNSQFSPTTGKYIIEVVMDSEEDVDYLPTDCSPGSIAVVADEGATSYMFNASGEWKEL